MPQVPYQAYPTVRPVEGAEQINISTPGAAFGENIARAVQGIGGELEKAGGEVFQRAIAIQDLANETEAREADAKYAMEQGQLHADYISNNPGAKARAALPQFLQQSNEMRQRYRDGLSNPAAQRLFDASSLGFMIRNVNSASIHAGEEFKKYTFGEAAATAKRAAESYVNPDDPQEVTANRDMGRAAIQSMAAQEDWGPQRTQEALETFDRGQRIGLIKAIAEKGNVPKAWEMLENSKEVLGDKYEAVREKVWNENEKRASKVYIDKIYDPDKNDADMAREVEQLVNDPKVNLGDPQFGIVMRHTLEYRIREGNTAQRRQKAIDTGDIYRTVLGGASTYSEVAATPQGQAALDSLERNNPKEFLNVKANIPKWAAKRDSETERQSMNMLQSISRDDPNGFLTIDLFDDKWKLSYPDRQHWLNVRDRILKEGGQSVKDPIVQQGIAYIQRAYPAQMVAAGLVDDKGRQVRGTDDWNDFWGYVDTSIRKYQEDNKKQPDKDALDEIARQAFVDHAEPGWFSRNLGINLGTNKVQEFRRTETEEDKEKARRELLKARPDQEPDDLQVRRWIIQQRWNKLHQGAGKKEEGASGGKSAPIPD